MAGGCPDRRHSHVLDGKLVRGQGAAVLAHDQPAQTRSTGPRRHSVVELRRPGGHRTPDAHRKNHGMSGTVAINARSAELFPETVRMIVQAGFEVAAHNYAQDEVLSGMSEAEERAVIQRCLGSWRRPRGRGRAAGSVRPSPPPSARRISWPGRALGARAELIQLRNSRLFDNATPFPDVALDEFSELVGAAGCHFDAERRQALLH